MKQFFSFVCLLILLSSCKDSYQTIFDYNLLPNAHLTRDDTIMVDSVSKKMFSRLSKKESLGIVFNYELPDSLQGKELYVTFDGVARSNYAFSNSYIVVAVTNVMNQQIIWKTFPLRYIYEEVNYWSTFNDSLYLSGNFDNKNYKNIQVLTSIGQSDSEIFDTEYLNIHLKVKK